MVGVRVGEMPVVVIERMVVTLMMMGAVRMSVCVAVRGFVVEHRL